MADEKYVRVFCDYYADPFWHKTGSMMGYEELPISGLLKLAFKAWDNQFQNDDKHLAYWSKDYGGKVLKYHSETGEELAKFLKKELPDWTVVYLNKYKSKEYRNKYENPVKENRSYFEHEITGE